MGMYMYKRLENVNIGMRNKMKVIIKCFFKEEDGVIVVEYGFIVGFIVVVFVSVMSMLMGGILGVFIYIVN